MSRNFSRLVLLALLLATPGRSAVVEQLDPAALTALADRVVVAEVGPAEVRALDGGRRLVTDSQVTVIETLKGPASVALVVRSSGGILGERGQKVPGSARLRHGARVLLFLEDRGLDETGQPRCRVVGMAQGLFELIEDGRGGRRAVQQLGGLAGLDPTTGTVAPLTTPAAPSETELRARINAALAAPPRP